MDKDCIEFVQVWTNVRRGGSEKSIFVPRKGIMELFSFPLFSNAAKARGI